MVTSTASSRNPLEEIPVTHVWTREELRHVVAEVRRLDDYHVDVMVHLVSPVTIVCRTAREDLSPLQRLLLLLHQAHLPVQTGQIVAFLYPAEEILVNIQHLRQHFGL